MAEVVGPAEDGATTVGRPVAGGRTSVAPIPEPRPWRGRRPADSADRLVGRDAEVSAVVAACAAHAVVTLVGPGGIGKSRLALAAAQVLPRDRDATWWVDVAELTHPADVERVVTDLLPVGVRGGVEGAPVSELAGGTALLVLDGCEHLVEAVAGLVGRLTSASPGLRVLATSREALGVGGERLLVVGPLESATHGVELFEERVAACWPDHDASAHREGVEEICRRLDGIPLAIELAAGWAPDLGIRRIAADLGDHLRLQSGGRRVAVERQRALLATVGWSYEHLRPHDRTLLAALSIFAGWFDVAAAEALVGRAPDGGGVGVGLGDTRPLAPIGGAIEARLGVLVDRSLLVAGHGRGGRRFRMSTTVRELGAEKLARDGATEARAKRHAEWCAVRVEGIGRQLGGHDALEAADRLADLWPQLRVAVDWACGAGDRRRAVRLVRPVLSEIVLRDRTEIYGWIERILDCTSPDGDPHEGTRSTGRSGSSPASARRAMVDDRSRFDRSPGG